MDMLTENLARPVHPFKNIMLAQYQITYICDALRRDMHEEERRASTDKAWAEYHASNARHNKDLLEILNPKTFA
jgi:hypothetical protein